MKIELKDYPRFKELLSHGYWDEVNKTAKGGMYYHCKLLMVCSQDDVDDFLKTGSSDDLPPDPAGYWLSNIVMSHPIHGVDLNLVSELTKVLRKERQVITTEVYYEP